MNDYQADQILTALRKTDEQMKLDHKKIYNSLSQVHDNFIQVGDKLSSIANSLSPEDLD